MNDQKMNSGIEIEGKTVDDAINKGLEQLGVAKEDVEIKILAEGSTGLFGLMGTKPAKVMIIPRDRVRVKPGFSPEIQKRYKDIEKIIKTETEKLLVAMEFPEAKVSVGQSRLAENQNEIKVDIACADDRDISLLIGRDGKTLAAIELIFQTILINKLLQGIPELSGNKPKISVDVNNYFERKLENALQDIQKAIGIVRRTGRDYRMEPMPAKIRRYIHNELKDNKEIHTVSEGEGGQRRVVITSRSGGRRQQQQQRGPRDNRNRNRQPRRGENRGERPATPPAEPRED